MLRDKLDKLLDEAARLQPPPDTGQWNARAFEGMNARLLAILDGAAERLGGFRERVELRRGVQELYQRVGAIDPAVGREIWSEQRDFYPELIDEIQRCIGDEDQSTVTFSLTVAELLYLLRLFIDGGIIQTETIRPILGYFSEHARTRKGRKLSFASLQKKYSQVEPETKQRVKRLLLGLAARVDTP